MINTIEKKNQVTQLKAPIKKDINDTVNIVYILNDDDIVYIGRTSQGVLKFVDEKSSKYHATHYYSEEIAAQDADNFLAELILKLQPIYNKNIPKNNKYISNSIAKESYFIPKIEFRKVFNEYAGIKYGNLLYLEKKLFDDIFAISEKYHQDMPRIGTLINTIDDAKRIELNVNCYIQQHHSFKNEDGNKVEQFIHLKTSAIKEYSKLEELQRLAYEVVEFVDSENFIAINHDTNDKKKFNAKDFYFYIDSLSNDNHTWTKLPPNYDIETLKSNYIKELQKEN